MRYMVFAAALLCAGPAMGQTARTTTENLIKPWELSDKLNAEDSRTQERELDLPLAFNICLGKRLYYRPPCELPSGEKTTCSYEPKWQEACAKIEKMKNEKDLDLVRKVAGVK